MARKSSTQPLIQVSSRGGRYALRKNTVARWEKAKNTIRLADQEWIERISQPNGTVVMMNSTDSNASPADGL